MHFFSFGTAIVMKTKTEAQENCISYFTIGSKSVFKLRLTENKAVLTMFSLSWDPSKNVL